MEKLLYQIYKSFEQRLVTAIVNALTEKLEKNMPITNSPQSCDEWMDLKSAAKYLNISENTLKNFLIRGLKVLEVGNVKRVNKSDLDRFIKKIQTKHLGEHTMKDPIKVYKSVKIGRNTYYFSVNFGKPFDYPKPIITKFRGYETKKEAKAALALIKSRADQGIYPESVMKKN